MSADAYATAFMVMGLEEAERFAKLIRILMRLHLYGWEWRTSNVLYERNGTVYNKKMII